MKVLVACEFSGTVREAFNAQGHYAVSCDLLPTEIPGRHVQADARDCIKADAWDLLIAHPPCTYLANSGTVWMRDRETGERNEERWKRFLAAAEFFKDLWNAAIPRIAIENPSMHSYGLTFIGAKPTQTIHPYQFGHMEKKRTCLWLRGLPKLQPTKVEELRFSSLARTPDIKDRWKVRSRTFPGVAQAMAEQWGKEGGGHNHNP